MKKLFILAVILIIGLTSCTNNDPVSIAIDIPSDPLSLDPQTATNPQALAIIHNIYEPLFTIDYDGQIKNAVAQSVDISSNSLLYTIKLKPDLFWSDGVTPLTAHDYVFALQRVVHNNTNSAYQSELINITNATQVIHDSLDINHLGVYAKDDLTLMISLELPDDNFLLKLTQTYAMPCNQQFFASSIGKYALTTSNTLSNGAFYVSNWSSGSSMRITKNSNYYDSPHVQLDYIGIWFSDKSDKSTVDKLANGDIHIGDISAYDITTISSTLKTIDNKDTVWGLVFSSNIPLEQRAIIADNFNRLSYQNYLPDSFVLADRILSPFYTNTSIDININDTLSTNNMVSYNVIFPSNTYINFADVLGYPSQILQRDFGIYFNYNEVSSTDVIANKNYDIAIIEVTSIMNNINDIINDPRYNCSDVDFADAIFYGNLLDAEIYLLENGYFIPVAFQTYYTAYSNKLEEPVINRFKNVIEFKDVKYIN